MSTDLMPAIDVLQTVTEHDPADACVAEALEGHDHEH